MADNESELPFIRNLASSDRKLRVASLESLQTHLKSLKSLTILEASKLWKGLFYALWMTDRPLPQQALATDLGNLLFKVRPACVDAWLRGFWTVVGAQWTGIDVLRLEKFLLLVRRVFAAHIQLVKEKGYESKEADMVLDVLREWPFDKEGDLRRVPVGIRLHALDIWIDELEKLETLTDPAAQTFVRKMGDMVEELKRCPVKPVRQRSAENLEDDRLPWVAKEDDMDEDDEDEEWGGIQD